MTPSIGNCTALQQVTMHVNAYKQVLPPSLTANKACVTLYMQSPINVSKTMSIPWCHRAFIIHVVIALAWVFTLHMQLSC